MFHPPGNDRQRRRTGIARAKLALRLLEAATTIVLALFAYFLWTSGALAADLAGRVVAVADGDTLTLLDSQHRQHKIRLADIDAPEKKQSFGTRSRQSLAELCFRKPAIVTVSGKDRYGREIGTVNCAGLDANAEQVRRGMAWVFVRYVAKSSPLYRIQAEARTEQRGLWSDAHPAAPWEWRRRHRERTAQPAL